MKSKIMILIVSILIVSGCSNEPSKTPEQSSDIIDQTNISTSLKEDHAAESTIALPERTYTEILNQDYSSDQVEYARVIANLTKLEFGWDFENIKLARLRYTVEVLSGATIIRFTDIDNVSHSIFYRSKGNGVIEYEGPVSILPINEIGINGMKEIYLSTDFDETALWLVENNY